jgi:DnaJ-class molecular chaperone
MSLYDEDKEKCPDCDSVDVWSPYSDKGDGKCSSCNGTGIDLIDDIGNSLNPFYQTDDDCDECHGTGICQTCRGDGEI